MICGLFRSVGKIAWNECAASAVLQSDFAHAAGTTLASRPLGFPPLTTESKMHLTPAHVAPLVALIAGILILIVPRLLNYIVVIYLIIIGLAGLNTIHHFIR